MNLEKIEIIKNIIKNQTFINITELSTRTNISRTSLIRYIDALVKNGYISKYHGGVKWRNSGEELLLDIKLKVNIKQKLEIAKKAAKLIAGADNIYIDSGSTTEQLTNFIKDPNIIIYTNSPTIAIKMSRRNSVILIGGALNKTTKAISGAQAMKFISKMVFDIAFMGANAIDDKNIYTTNIAEALLKEKVINNSKKTYVLVELAKMNKKSHVIFAQVDKVRIINENK